MDCHVLASQLLSRRARRGPVLVVFAAFFVAGCHDSLAPPVALTHTITPWPPRVGQAEIRLALQDAASKPLSGAHVALEADMSHPGMPPVFGETREITPGTYDGQVELGMAGDWFVLVHITLANGQRLEKQIELKGVETK